jgi:hypothetical protein
VEIAVGSLAFFTLALVNIEMGRACMVTELLTQAARRSSGPGE